MDTPAQPFILSLPAEILIKICNDPGLFRDDLANLRLSCKRISVYATEAFAKECLSDSLRFELLDHEFTRLAAICSSDLQPFLKSVHFVEGSDYQLAQIDTSVCPDYSSIRNIKLETPLYNMEHTLALEKVLQRANSLENFMFSPVMVSKGIHWFEKHEASGTFQPENTHYKLFDVKNIEKVTIILSSIRSGRLSELILADTILPYGSLQNLLERHSSTIRELSLRNCRLVDGTWLDLLQWIPHGLPRLEHLDLQCLREINSSQPLHWNSWSAVMWKDLVTNVGKKNIDAYMTSLKKGEKS